MTEMTGLAQDDPSWRTEDNEFYTRNAAPGTSLEYSGGDILAAVANTVLKHRE